MPKRPLRTCIACRVTFEQDKLYRLQCIDKKISNFTGIGRSFYFCNRCLEDTKRLEKALYRQCKNKDEYMVQLKEIIANGR